MCVEYHSIGNLSAHTLFACVLANKMKRNIFDPITLVTLQTSTFYTRILFIIKKIKYFDNEIFNKLITKYFF